MKDLAFGTIDSNTTSHFWDNAIRYFIDTKRFCILPGESHKIRIHEALFLNYAMNLRSSCLFFAAFAVGNSNANDIPSTAIAAGNFDTLVAALSATNLVDAVSQPGPFTVFAPTDEAFEQLPEGLVGCLLEEENLPILSDILLYHVVDGEAFSTDLTDGMEIKTLYGESVTVKIVDNGNTVLINGVEVVVPDVEATNGVIHIIDQVLVPDSIDVEGFYETCGFGTEEEKDVAKDVGGLVDIPTLAIEVRTKEAVKRHNSFLVLKQSIDSLSTR